MLTISAKRFVVGLTALGGLALLSATASAQTVSPRGEIEFGTRQLFGDLASSKFLEYRSIPEGPFLNRLALGLDWPERGYYVSLSALDALEGDQSVRVGAGQHGRFAFTFDYGKTPHLFSTSTRTIYTETAPGVFALPNQVQSTLRTILTTDTDAATAGVQPDLASLEAIVEGLARPVAADLIREKGTASLRYTPAPAWDVQVQYSLENQRGARPFGATFSFSPSEQAEPIDYRTHDVRASVEWSAESWSVQAGYQGSIYRNEVDVLIFDNPFQPTDAAGNPSRGQIDLYPDNAAHQGTLSAALKLPLESRWTASAAYGVFSQNDAFQPFTINPAVANVPSLPATSADARIKTLLLNTAVTTRPVRPLTVTARYRRYDRNNETPSLDFANYVRTDQLLGGVVRRNLPIAYTRQDASVETSWRVVGPVAVRAGYNWEGWDREHRETIATDDHTLSGAVDVTHRGWLFLRAAFRRSDRTAHDYEAHRVADETFPAGEPGLGQLEELRKFDQADRERDRAELIARVSPGDQLSFSVTYSLTNDTYDKSEYGVLASKSWSPAVELSYSPVPRLSFFADYAHEHNSWSMRSRQRVPATATAPANDKPDNDWISDIESPVNTYGVGASGWLLPERLQLDLSYSFSDGNGRTATRTPGTPDLVTTAVDYPDIVSDLQSLNATLRYDLGPRVAVRFDYRFEEYNQEDFALDPMTSFMGNLEAISAGSVWLGATRPDFRAHISSLSLSYRF